MHLDHLFRGVLMRIDETYKPKQRSNQSELPGLGSKGEQTYKKAIEWIEKHPVEFEYMEHNAIRLSKRGVVSANYLVNMVRNEKRVSIPNACAPAFARILEAREPSLVGKFKNHASQVDGFC